MVVPGVSPPLIGGGAIDLRQRHVNLPQVDRELPAMMDQMVQMAAHDLSSRRSEEHLVPVPERPGLVEARADDRAERRSRLLDVTIELA